VTLEYDLDVGALYIRFAQLPIATTKEFGDNANVDLDAAGRVVGIEVISAAHRWPLIEILAAYELESADLAQLRAYFVPSSISGATGQRLQEPLPVVEAEPTPPAKVAVAA